MTASRRVLVAGLGVVAVMLMAVAGLLLGRHQATLNTPPQPAASSPATTDTPTSAPMDDGSPSSLPTVTEPQGGHSDRSPDRDTDEAKQLREQTIEGFAKRFTNTYGGQKAWVARLRPYVTEDVLNSLATVDVNDVPKGHFGEYEILQGWRNAADRSNHLQRRLVHGYLPDQRWDALAGVPL